MLLFILESSLGLGIISNDRHEISQTDFLVSTTLYKALPKVMLIGIGPYYSHNLNAGGALFQIEVGPNWKASNNLFGLRYVGAFASHHHKENHADFNFFGTEYQRLIPWKYAELTPGIGFGYCSTKRHKGLNELGDNAKAGTTLKLGSGMTFNMNNQIYPYLRFNYLRMFERNSMGHPQIFGLEVGLITL